MYQLVVGSIALLGLIYVWYSQETTSNLRAYVMALSNSWGLILVVIFMGYGMVDVPRRLWHKGDNARELRRISFKASVVKDKRQDTEDEVLNVAKVGERWKMRRYAGPAICMLSLPETLPTPIVIKNVQMDRQLIPLVFAIGTICGLPQASVVRPAANPC